MGLPPPPPLRPTRATIPRTSSLCVSGVRGKGGPAPDPAPTLTLHSRTGSLGRPLGCFLVCKQTAGHPSSLRHRGRRPPSLLKKAKYANDREMTLDTERAVQCQLQSPSVGGDPRAKRTPSPRSPGDRQAGSKGLAVLDPEGSWPVPTRGTGRERSSWAGPGVGQQLVRVEATGDSAAARTG